jgi:hypothetical protein
LLARESVPGRQLAQRRGAERREEIAVLRSLHRPGASGQHDRHVAQRGRERQHFAFMTPPQPRGNEEGHGRAASRSSRRRTAVLSERSVDALNEQIAREFAAAHQYVWIGAHYAAQTLPQLSAFIDHSEGWDAVIAHPRHDRRHDRGAPRT